VTHDRDSAQQLRFWSLMEAALLSVGFLQISIPAN